ncbi:MAG: TerC/Alx family metal homeostasis membrane protein [Bacteroidia bacterium]|nr:TerC family protein [Bacteroidia bacterium]MCZ2276623.1 TerC/Alx family metal homeostasis membrane protein [Bacteroidia bacterium]
MNQAITTEQWFYFISFLSLMLILDLFVFNRKAHTVSYKESFLWVSIWVLLAVGFAFYVSYEFGKEASNQFIAAYVVELTLSVDNLFAFILIFTYFNVPSKYHHKILFYGIVGALVLRLGFIIAGVALLEKIHWMIYIFGGILFVSGIKMLKQENKTINPDRNIVIRFVRKTIPVLNRYEEDKFFVKENGRWAATLLFVVLLMIELTDVIFAVDSVPAVLSISKNTFIVFTSNAFAILGLRSLYFALAGLISLFRFLHYGLSVILIFVGLKMVLSEFYEISSVTSLYVVLSILCLSILFSVMIPKKQSN